MIFPRRERVRRFTARPSPFSSELIENYTAIRDAGKDTISGALFRHRVSLSVTREGSSLTVILHGKGSLGIEYGRRILSATDPFP